MDSFLRSLEEEGFTFYDATHGIVCFFLVLSLGHSLRDFASPLIHLLKTSSVVRRADSVPIVLRALRALCKSSPV